MVDEIGFTTGFPVHRVPEIALVPDCFESNNRAQELSWNKAK